MAAAASVPYPVRFDIEDLERQSRWKAALRLPLAIPTLLFAALLQGGFVVALWIAIVLTGRAPRWLFDWVVAVNRWGLRSGAYFALLTDRYPAFEDEYPVRYDVQVPDRLSRWKVLIWKTVTSIPHVVVLGFLSLSLVIVLPVAWVAIIALGRFPRGLRSYVVGIFAWGARVQAYVLSLTDDFPPFDLTPQVGVAQRDAYVTSSVLGVLVVGAIATGLGLFVAFGGQHVTRVITYDSLLEGTAAPPATVHMGEMRLLSVDDPADGGIGLFRPEPGHRFVAFSVAIKRTPDSGETVHVTPSVFRLKDSNGGHHLPVLVGVDGVLGDGAIPSGQSGDALIVFELPGDDPPLSLTWDVLDYITQPRVGETIVWEFR